MTALPRWLAKYSGWAKVHRALPRVQQCPRSMREHACRDYGCEPAHTFGQSLLRVVNALTNTARFRLLALSAGSKVTSVMRVTPAIHHRPQKHHVRIEQSFFSLSP